MRKGEGLQMQKVGMVGGMKASRRAWSQGGDMVWMGGMVVG